MDLEYDLGKVKVNKFAYLKKNGRIFFGTSDGEVSELEI